MVTMRDVARRAGVSTATVSAVLNGEKGQASLTTSERVREAVRDLGYIPNPMGRNLRKRESRMWTLTVPSIENPFITQVIRGVEDTALESGYSLLLGHTQDDPERERKYLEVASAGLSDGVIMVPTTTDVDISGLRSRSVPVVSIVRPLEIAGGVSTVLMDNLNTARAATRFLIDSGMVRIAYLAGPQGMYADEKRLEGYRAELIAAGIAPDERLVTFTPATVDGGRDAARTLVKGPAPDALIVASSLMALGVVETYREAGRTIAEYPTMVMIDDAPWAGPLMPFAHVMEQPAYELGCRAGRMLLQHISAPETPVRIERLPARIREATV